MEEVAKNIYRIGVPLPGNPLKELNSYFIRGGDSDLLIDTGFRMEECETALRRGLEELGYAPERLDVLATHLHSDHAGMVDLFVGPGRRVYMSGADLDYQQDIMLRDVRKRGNRRFLEEGFPPEQLEAAGKANPAWQKAFPALAIDGRFHGLEDGNVLTVGEYDLKVLSVPGHTPGNIMLWAEKQGIMFTGDHVLFDITPNITAWMGMEDALGDYLDSLRRVREYPVELALPGHRKSGDYKARIDRLLRHHEARLAETLDIITRTPGLNGYEIAGRMTWQIRADSWDTFPVVQKWFAVGECMSHLDYLRRRGKVGREMVDGCWRYSAAV